MDLVCVLVILVASIVLQASESDNILSEYDGLVLPTAIEAIQSVDIALTRCSFPAMHHCNFNRLISFSNAVGAILLYSVTFAVNVETKSPNDGQLLGRN